MSPASFPRHLSLPAMLLLVLAILRPWLEESMARHMALEFPALFLAGWLFARHARPTDETPFSEWNNAGVAGMLLSSLLLMCWMLPVAFDAAVLDWRIALLKVATLLLSGFLAGWAWPRLHLLVRSAFLVNLAGMNIVLGVLYLAAPQQLCSAYRSDGQLATGLSLLLWGGLILTGFMVWWIRALVHTFQPRHGKTRDL